MCVDYYYIREYKYIYSRQLADFVILVYGLDQIQHFEWSYNGQTRQPANICSSRTPCIEKRV
jgi:hypothetical protein